MCTVENTAYKYGCKAGISFLTSMSSVFDRTAFQHLNGIIGDFSGPCDVSAEHKPVVATFMSEMSILGYSLSQDIVYYISSLEDPTERCLMLLRLAKGYVGGLAYHRVMYPNFPQQVMDASEAEQYFNAAVHYASGGLLVPSYDTAEREKLTEKNPQTSLSLISTADLQGYFLKLLYAKSSLPGYLAWGQGCFIDMGIKAGWADALTEEIPFKETLAVVAAKAIKEGKSIRKLMRQTTDVLRVMAYILGSDVQLKRKVKFTSFPRKTRRMLMEALESVISVEDVKRHPETWKRAFHNLHVGEYKYRYPGVYKIAEQFRNQNNVPTSATVVAEAIKLGDYACATQLLAKTPSIFARSLDKLLRDGDSAEVLKCFRRLVGSIDSKVLLQVLGHLKARPINEKERRVVVTAGRQGRGLIVEPLPALASSVVEEATLIVRSQLLAAFKGRALLAGKKVHIRPEVSGIMLPLLLASVSGNMKTVGRGSTVPLDLIPEDSSKNILRLFLNWYGCDQDLSAVVVDANFEKTLLVSFSNLKEDYAWHSGDITDASGPDGASEFIDVDMNGVLSAGFRYVVMDCRVYEGLNFSWSLSFAGYMLREKAQSGEIYEPTTVRAKFDLTGETYSTTACAFDVKERTMCWVDSDMHIEALPNSVTNNMAASLDILKAYTGYTAKRVTMGELVELHAGAVGADLVEELEADFVVGLGTGDLDVYDFATILRDWV